MSYNWDLLVFGPEFAMLRIPRPVWDRLGRNSSLKGFPQKDSPPEDGERMTERRKTTENITSRWKTTETVKSLITYLFQSPNWRAVLTLSCALATWLKMFLQVKLQYLLRLNLLHCRHWVMLAGTVDGCCTSCCPAFKVLELSILAHWRCLLGAIHILKTSLSLLELNVTVHVFLSSPMLLLCWWKDPTPLHPKNRVNGQNYKSEVKSKQVK